MGIRIKKMLGYGLRNLRMVDEKPGDKHTMKIPKDRRWDYEKYRAECYHREDTLEDYVAWCEAHKDRLVSLLMTETGETDERHARIDHTLMLHALRDKLEKWYYWVGPHSSFQWNREFGLPKVILFIPPENHHDWQRYDNIIDYYEEQPITGPKTRATYLRGSTGIWPYSGFMCRVREPSPEVAEQYEALRKVVRVFVKTNTELRMDGGTYNRLVGRWAQNIEPLVTNAALLRHLKRDWRPTLPLGVIAMIEYMGCFPDAFGPKGIAADLRPMIYVYWS